MTDPLITIIASDWELLGFGIIVFLNFLDGLTTILVMGSYTGGEETNPIGRWVFSKFGLVPGTVFYKAFVANLLFVIFWTWYRGTLMGYFLFFFWAIVISAASAWNFAGYCYHNWWITEYRLIGHIPLNVDEI